MLIVQATPEGRRIATDLNEWPHLKIIELSILATSIKGCESVTLFRIVKDLRENPYLDDVVIAQVVERLTHRGLLRVKQR